MTNNEHPMTSISEKDLDYTAELNSDDDLNSFNDQLHISNNRQTKQLSETQQERLLQYFEDQLLNIQRRFVSRLNLQMDTKTFTSFYTMSTN